MANHKLRQLYQFAITSLTSYAYIKSEYTRANANTFKSAQYTGDIIIRAMIGNELPSMSPDSIKTVDTNLMYAILQPVSKMLVSASKILHLASRTKSSIPTLLKMKQETLKTVIPCTNCSYVTGYMYRIKCKCPKKRWCETCIKEKIWKESSCLDNDTFKCGDCEGNYSIINILRHKTTDIEILREEDAYFHFMEAGESLKLLPMEPGGPLEPLPIITSVMGDERQCKRRKIE